MDGHWEGAVLLPLNKPTSLKSDLNCNEAGELNVAVHASFFQDSAILDTEVTQFKALFFS